MIVKDEEVKFCIKCGTKLIVKSDHEGKVRKMCAECDWIFYENPLPAAVCVILNKKREILLIKRKVEPSAGKWALPSGYVEIDQTPEKCAVVELKEETGLKGKIISFLGYNMQTSQICKKVISFGFHLKKIGGKLIPGDDALDAKFFPIKKIPELPFSSHKKFIQIIKKQKGIL